MSERPSDSDLSSFEARCRELLGGSVEGLDSVRQARLSAARATALDAMAPETFRPFRVPGAWLPAGTLAATAVLVLAVWWVHPGSRATVADTSPVEDVELLVSGEGPDLYADDAAFYDWVADVGRDPG
jgi:hypothetical protein